MRLDDVSRFLGLANRRRHAIRLRAVNLSGNTVEMVGYVTEVRRDGGIRFCEGDAVGGQVHDFSARSVLRVERAHDA
ncbi:MAG TPA: hypothetical protein VFY93_08205 [Planctomycetota bacterium]|nr:hypothetical protein [Planctomycetota bacterium]